MDYQRKYLKYKTKYLSLKKKQKGGAVNLNHIKGFVDYNSRILFDFDYTGDLGENDLKNKMIQILNNVDSGTKPNGGEDALIYDAIKQLYDISGHDINTTRQIIDQLEFITRKPETITGTSYSFTFDIFTT